MKKITLKKLSKSDLMILQNEIFEFTIFVGTNMIKTEFLNAISLIDISNALFYQFRNRLEKGANIHTLHLPISHAITILKALSYDRYNRDELSTAVSIRIAETINQQLNQYR